MTQSIAARSRRELIAMTTTAIALVHAVPALAQADGASSDTTDIIVTAQRRAERLEDVPVSVTALSGSDLEKANVVSFRDIETVSPGTRISSIGVFTQPAIRGITSTAVGPGIENNVAFYVDGFYQPDNAALGSDFANVTAVQVLKGPQGTLYGRNALGGAILVNTREPSADEELILDVEGSYGSRNDKRFRAYLGGRLADGLSLGIGAYYRRNDGYIRTTEAAATQPVVNQPIGRGVVFPNYITPNTDGRNAAPYQNSEVRIKLKFEPSSDITLVWGYNNLYKFNPTALAYPNLANAYFSGLPVPAPGSPARAVGRDEYSGNFNPDFHTKQNEATFKVVWDLGFGTLSSYTNYIDLQPLFDSDYDGTLVNFLRIRSDFDRQTFAESFDFTMEPNPALTVVVGGLYYKDDATSVTMTQTVQPVPTTSATQKSTAYALFGDITWEVANGLFLNGGLRYSYEKKRINALLRDGTRPTAEKSFDDLTPKVTARYEIGPRTNVYASYSQGFKSGLFNSIGQSAPAVTTPVRPETVEAFEVGFKTAQGGFRVDTAAYYYDYSNLQVSSLVGGGGVVGVFVTNAAAAEIYGAELSVAATPVEALNLRLGVAYTHARYTDYKNAAVQILQTPPGSTVPRNVDGVQDLSGERIQRAPDWTISLGADYTLPVGDGTLVLAGNFYYSSEYAPTSEALDPLTGDPRFYQDAYATGSASITYNLPGDRWWLRGFVDNVNNKRFKIVDTASGRGEYHIYSEPRRFGVTIGYRH